MPPEKQSEFQIEIDRFLRPKLESLGFTKVTLKDCMRPEVLFNNERLWFGASWDYRDLYLDVDLGHLYWFKDVMPRVMVLGGYSNYSSRINSVKTDSPKYLAQIAEILSDTIEGAIAIYNSRYDEILKSIKDPKKFVRPAEFFTHLGNEVAKSDLEQFTA